MDLRAVQYQKNSEILKKYLPPQSVELIAVWIVQYDFKLKIKKERSTRLGDYKPPRPGYNHTITINHNLNRYAFLITLVHEVAHLVTYNEHKNHVNPHGREWKQNFQKLIQPFLNTDIFPLEVFAALRSYMQNPAASSCSDVQLLKTLKLHDEDSGAVFLEYLPHNTLFLYNGSRLFQKGEKIRKRFKCLEVNTGMVYLFNPLAEVEVFEPIVNAQ
ncbi:MAG: SprT-like domain-containing protein [Bacteroidia bacterium]|nr:SprT-like domain-containing protein [Bacteroidia bacterium]